MGKVMNKNNDIRNLSIIYSESLENIQKFSNSKKEMKGKQPHCHVIFMNLNITRFVFEKKEEEKERVSRWKWKAKQQHQHKMQNLTKQNKTRTKQNEEKYTGYEKALYGNDKFWQFMETWGLEFFERNQIVEDKWLQSIKMQRIP